jgi:hypothetical protein
MARVRRVFRGDGFDGKARACLPTHRAAWRAGRETAERGSVPDWFGAHYPKMDRGERAAFDRGRLQMDLPGNPRIRCVPGSGRLRVASLRPLRFLPRAPGLLSRASRS